MDLNARIRRLSLPQKVLLLAVYAVVLALLMVLAAEAALRFKGLTPWKPAEISVRITPGGSLYRSHPTLGYSHLPGEFTVTLADGYSFHVTHLPSTLRATHPPEKAASGPPREEIWIFGCSFTHGWSLNDEETYPWLLQQRLPEYEVVNFGVTGYGTIQALHQFREELRRTRPKVAVLAYAGFHDPRNTCLRGRQKEVAPYNRLGPLDQPYASLDEQGKLKYGMTRAVYRELPLQRRLALVNFADDVFNRNADQFHRSREVSKALIREIARLAAEQGTRLVFAQIFGGREMLDFARANDIPAVDMSVDLDLPENRNLPHDGHPSALANRKYAETLEAFLHAGILKSPPPRERPERSAP